MNLTPIVITKANTSSSSTIQKVAASTSCTTFLHPNVDRVGVTIYNKSVYPLYIALSADASTEVFTTMLYANGYFELPKGYTGSVSGIWSSSAVPLTGYALVTEF